MGEVIDVEAELLKDNPDISQTVIVLAADALRIYTKAAANVAQYGTIVQHPRTGSPLENPYLKIMDGKAILLLKMQHVKTDRVFAMLKASVVD